MAACSESRLPMSRDTLWLHRNKMHYGKRDPHSWLKSITRPQEHSGSCVGDNLNSWMKGNFFSNQPSPPAQDDEKHCRPHTPPRQKKSPPRASENSPMKLSCPQPSNSPKRIQTKAPKRQSLLRLASEEDQKLVQKILEVLRSHNGHIRRLSWTDRNDTKGSEKANRNIGLQAAAPNTSNSTCGSRKRSRSVSFQEGISVRYVEHDLTDYGLPMMTAIPGTGNGTTNPESEWHQRPHTGWYNKHVGSGSRPRWWYYDNEIDDDDDDDSFLSISEESKSSDETEEAKIAPGPRSPLGKRQQESLFDYEIKFDFGDKADNRSLKRHRTE